MSPTPDARNRSDEANFAGAREGVAVLAPNWRIRYMNASMLEILRLIGHRSGVETLWDALPDWEHSEPADDLRHAMESGAAVCFRVDGRRGAGRVWQVDAEPLDTGELRVRLRNVTGQAQQEAAARLAAQAGPGGTRQARLAAMVAAAPVGMVLMDADSLVVREANAFCERFLDGEWRRPGAIMGHAAGEWLPRFAEPGMRDAFLRAARTGEPFEEPEVPHDGPGGAAFFRWTLQPAGSRTDGRPKYLLLVVMDDTAHVLARRTAEAGRAALDAHVRRLEDEPHGPLGDAERDEVRRA